MKIIKSLIEMKKIAINNLKQNFSVGFIPTMGNLHDGHISLIKTSIKENKKSIVSIFVNPIQFSDNEDFKSYPRSIDIDIQKLEELNIDYLFIPTINELYSKEYQSYIQVKELTQKLCGISRPHFFSGVSTICIKLFNLTMPSTVYFGQKDYQQFLVIRQLIKDFNITLKIKILPIIREKQGLALSSRNNYLNNNEKNEALKLYESLQIAKNLLEQKETNAKIIKNSIIKHLKQSSIIKIDYVSICNTESLEEVIEIKNKILIAVAIYIKKTRLIDNFLKI